MPTLATAFPPEVHRDYLGSPLETKLLSDLEGEESRNEGVATFILQGRHTTAHTPSDHAPVTPYSPSAASVGFLSATVSTIHDLLALTEQSSTTRARFERRLHLLAEEAEAEGYAFNPDSEVTFRWFLNRYPFLKPGRLFLMDNGNLSATWRDERDTHVGLQFLPGDSVQYVIFTRRPSSRMISRVHGYDTLDAIPRLLAAYDLGDVLGT